jgi:exosortase A-associated hydrolase 2
VRVTPQPVTIAGASGDLFGIFWSRHPVAPCDAAVLVAPPFAEEMNKCRRMLALTAAALGASGCPTLHVDLHGTGDSAGDFGDARWSGWLDDLGRASVWLRSTGARQIYVLGVRAGALLATDLDCRPEAGFGGLILWQPVLAGAQHLTQLLRTRIAAAAIGAGTAAAETTATLRRELADRGRIEIAGYTIAAELADALDRARLDSAALPATARVAWFEVVASEEASLSPPAASLLATWRAASIDAQSTLVTGEPFWATTEIAVVPRLVDATVAVATAWRT